MGHGASAIDKTKSLGNQYFAEGKFEAAASCYSMALRHDPYNKLLLSNRCACYLKLNQIGFALEDALKCKEVAGDWVKSFFRLGQVFQALGLYVEAKLLAMQAKGFSPADKAIQELLRAAETSAGDQGPGNLYEWSMTSMRPQTVAALRGVVLSDLACGVTHCVGVSSHGEVYVWGDNKHSQCGLSGQDVSSPTLLPNLLGKNVVGVACGAVHSVVVCADGSAYAWGINTKLQCGIAQPAQITTPTLIMNYAKGVAAGLAHTLILTDTGTVKACGWNNCGQLGLGHTRDSVFTEIAGRVFVHLSCGGAHSLFVTKDGNLFAAGSNSCGQLGLGHSSDVPNLTLVDRLQGLVSYAACGEEYSIAVTYKGQCFTFGLGNVGQLGDGRDSVRETPELLSLEEAIDHLCCTKAQVIATSKRARVYSWGSWGGAPHVPLIITNIAMFRTHFVRASRDHFYLTTKYSEPQRSFLNDLPVAGMIAGVSHSITVELIDNDGLFNLNSGDSVQCVCVSESGEAIVARVDFVRGKHLVSLKFNEAGAYKLFGLVNSCLVRFAPYVIKVRPGIVASAIGYLTLQAAAGTSEVVYLHAGSMFAIELESKDAYGNTCETSVVSKDLRAELNGLTIDFNLETTVLSRTVLKCAMTKAGTHDLKLYFRGSEVPCTFQELVVEEGIKRIKDKATLPSINIRVFPGLIQAQSCTVSQLSFASSVGEVWAWIVSHKDLFGNETWHKPEAFDISLQIGGVRQDVAQELALDYCKTHVTSRPTKAGQGVLSVKYQGTLVATKTIDVSPGPPSAPHCRVHGEGLESTCISKAAEIVRSFDIELFDKYGNPASSPSVTVTIRNNLGEQCLTELQGSTCTYRVTKPGIYTIDIQVEHWSLEGFPYTIAVSRDPLEVEVEQRELHMRLLLEARRKAEEEEALRAKQEQDAKEAAERKRLEEARKRAELEAAKVAARLKAEEELELEKRKRIAEKIKRQAETERRAAEALEKLKALRTEEKPKARRTGGGFLLIET
mmetsp:Transcript_7874/g.15240  ORF Transcript_7874/g.15240 Transcript_7874/m.15240 type:complete len:1011 (-) Transcript_7874:3959-6991(-)